MAENFDDEVQLLENVAAGINQLNLQPNWGQFIHFQEVYRSLAVREQGEPLVVVVTEDGTLGVNRVPGQMKKENAREDMVRNHVGGFVFQVSDETLVRRFLILGTSGGTYYATEKEHTMENLNELIKIIEKGNGAMIVKEIREISLAGRNPKQESLLFALALCARYRVGDLAKMLETHKKAEVVTKLDPDNDNDVVKAYRDYISALHAAAFSVVNEVCRIPTHLFAFVKYCEMVAQNTSKNKSTGWGRAMRNCVTNWFATKSPDQLAMHVTKSPQREGWSHRDLFRLAHPDLKKTISRGDFEDRKLEYEQVYRYVVKGDLQKRKRKYTPEDRAELGYEPETKYSAVQLDNELGSKALNLIEAVLNLKNEKDEAKVVEAIKTHKLVREHVPTDMLNSVAVWHALLEKMPMTALIRNLGKLSTIKALDDAHTDKVVKQLTDEAELKKARIHPLNVLLAKTTYAAGRGFRGSLTWDVNPKIDDALEQAFYKSFVNAPPTGKRFCFAFDVSGSMTMPISGTHLSCRVASAALSLVSLRQEPLVECVGFCDHLVELPFEKTWDINRICDYVDNLEFGQTDCALPMLWAAEKGKKFDVFVVYTDNETYYGDVHPFEALRQYREKSGIHDARLIVMGMTATKFTIADPTDAGMLDIAGFDSAVPALISEFINGGV
ncbi:hypothetical protein WR25_14306 [Diploscapter pachys]|uniref:TROVE domain-containing protein n=1 Tax=Diploscapter pachys TaxID=2018661 RepID=A0A2A2KH02_9BILA|nr:hypothetical protein WR25_14306 [Diploscapter pachys]